MPSPLIYVGVHAVQTGKLEIAKQASTELATFLEANHPRMVAFEIYFDDDASDMTVIQVHPDEDSLRHHLQIAGEKIARAYEFLDATRKIDIYGTPSDGLVDQIRQMAMDAPVRFNKPHAGFNRFVRVAA